MAWNPFQDMYNSWTGFTKLFTNTDKVFQGLANGFKELGQGVYNTFSGLWDDFTGKTNTKMNLDFQRENLDYQKALQQKMFEREDTAYQRTGADMRSAGLSPLSMSGVNGAGEVVSTEAMNAQKTSDIQALGQIFNTLNSISNTRSNATVSQAQANLINAQADNQKIKNLWENDILSNTLDSINFKNIGQQFSNERANIAWQQDVRNLAFNDQFGLSDNMPEFAKIINFATHQGNLNNDWFSKHQPDNWNDFGKTFTHYTSNPNFNSIQKVLEQSNLLGALQDNALTNTLLKLIGIGS